MRYRAAAKYETVGGSPNDRLLLLLLLLGGVRLLLGPNKLVELLLMEMEGLVDMRGVAADKAGVQHRQLTPYDHTRIIDDLSDLR